MKIPKVFIPDKDLEEKIKNLSKKNYKVSKKAYSENPSFTEISERISPILENFEKTVYGKKSQNSIQLESIPDNYRGWIDFFDTNYESFKRYYCTMFDLQLKEGRTLQRIFSNSQREYRTYHFKPNSSFEMKGKLIKKGYINGFKWYILKTDEKRN